MSEGGMLFSYKPEDLWNVPQNSLILPNAKLSFKSDILFAVLKFHKIFWQKIILPPDNPEPSL